MPKLYTTTQRLSPYYTSLNNAIFALPALLEAIGKTPEPGFLPMAFIAIGSESLSGITNAALNGNERTRGRACLILADCIGIVQSYRSSEYEYQKVNVDSHFVPLALNTLIKSMHDTAPTVRAETAYALGRLRKDNDLILQALTQGLTDSDPGVRRNSLLALSRWGPKAKAAMPALLRALSDPDISVRDFATNAIRYVEVNATLSTNPKP